MFKQKVSARAFVNAAASNDINTIKRYKYENNGNNNAVNVPIENGMTALMMAVKHGNYHIVLELLGTPGINVNAADHDGNTALMFAAVHGRLEITLALLKVNDINVNAINQDGFTPLAKAAAQGHEHIVTALLRVRDINLKIVNIFSRTAAQEAEAHGQHEIAVKIGSAEIAAKIKRHDKRLDYSALICPFSKIRMQDPITISTTGVTCDRAAYKNYFALSNDPDSMICPFTGKVMFRKEVENATNITVQQHLIAAAHQDSIEDDNDYWYESATSCVIC